MYVLNFGHPLTELQLTDIEKLCSQPVSRLTKINVQVDLSQPLRAQVVALAEQAQLSPNEWQTVPLLVSLPGLATVTACLLAEIEGRRGHLPAIISLRPFADALVPGYEVAEIVNLHHLRTEARSRRYIEPGE